MQTERRTAVIFLYFIFCLLELIINKLAGIVTNSICAKRDWIQLLISKHELILSDDVRSLEEISKIFTSGFEEVLLPAQIDDLGRVLKQRRVLMESQIEAFVLPASSFSVAPL